MSQIIKKIYKKYRIPQNLQMHMLRVAAVADLIVDNWYGPKINREKLLRVLLLHDMGNIIKIDPINQEGDSTKISDFITKDIEELERIKKKYISLYGNDDHKISREIGRELGLSEDELELMDSKVFIRNDETILSYDYNIKIGAYADQRVDPNGVRGIMERLLEAKERYKDRPGSSMNNPRTEMLIESAAKLEQQVMKYCNLEPSDINDRIITPYINKMECFLIKET